METPAAVLVFYCLNHACSQRFAAWNARDTCCPSCGGTHIVCSSCHQQKHTRGDPLTLAGWRQAVKPGCIHDGCACPCVVPAETTAESCFLRQQATS